MILFSTKIISYENEFDFDPADFILDSQPSAKFDGGGGGSDVEQASTLDPAQQELLRISADFLKPRVGQGATPLPFDPFAPTNSLFEQAFSQFQTSFQDTSSSDYIEQNLRRLVEGEDVYQPDIQGVSRDFTENVLNPATTALNETLGLNVQNQLNQPGRLFASDTKKEVGKAISRELGLSTLPLLAQAIEGERGRGFSSAENALARTIPALSALQMEPLAQFQQAFGVAEAERSLRQQELDARAREFLRLSPEEDPFLKMAMGFSTVPTMENIVTQQPDRMGQLLGAGAGILTGMATGGTGFFAASDINVKENIQEIEQPIEILEHLKGYTYNYISDTPDKRSGGIMAQDLETVLPGAVPEIDGVKHVDYTAVIGVLVEAVKGLKSEIEELKKWQQ